MSFFRNEKAWPLFPLKEIATLKRGYDLPVSQRTSGDVPIFAANGQNGSHSEVKVEGPGVITGRSGTIGKVHYCEKDYWPLNTSLYVTDFHGNYPKWVYYMLRAFKLERFSEGAGVPTLNRNLVHDELIPLPPPKEQQRIAAILDKAAAIRRKRQQAIVLVDELLRAVFLDMFGDPVTNPKGWIEHRLSDIADVRSGVTKGRKIDLEDSETLPYMRVANVQDGYLDLSDVKQITVSKKDAKKFTLKEGDLLLTEGGDPDKLGRGYVWGGEIHHCLHQNHIFSVRIKESKRDLVKPGYLSAITASQRGKKYFLRMGKQTTGIATINKTVLSEFPVLIPPIELQKKYILISEDILNFRDKFSSADENLFESCQNFLFHKES